MRDEAVNNHHAQLKEKTRDGNELKSSQRV